MTDYQYFDSRKELVLYEFGFGLSYTSFALSNLEVNKLSRGAIALTPSPNAPILPGGNSKL